MKKADKRKQVKQLLKVIKRIEKSTWALDEMQKDKKQKDYEKIIYSLNQAKAQAEFKLTFMVKKPKDLQIL